MGNDTRLLIFIVKFIFVLDYGGHYVVLPYKKGGSTFFVPDILHACSNVHSLPLPKHHAQPHKLPGVTYTSPNPSCPPPFFNVACENMHSTRKGAVLGLGIVNPLHFVKFVHNNQVIQHLEDAEHTHLLFYFTLMLFMSFFKCLDPYFP